MEQDEIGWQNFVEGKITRSWGMLQIQHYQEQHSKRTVDKWTSGLVTQLLELTHGMWLHRNGVLHAVDAQGLPLQQAAELEAAIHDEFRKIRKGLPVKTTILFVEAEMMLCLCQWWIRGDGCKVYNWLANPVRLHLRHTNDNNN
jgi:hypothetical protein